MNKLSFQTGIARPAHNNFHYGILAESQYCSAFAACGMQAANYQHIFSDRHFFFKRFSFSSTKNKKIVKKPKNYLHKFFSSLQLAPISNKNH